MPDRYEAATDMLAELHREALPEKLPLAPHIDYAIPAFDTDAMLVEIGLMLEWYLPDRGAEVVIERDAEAVAVLRPAGPSVRLLSESLRLATERGSNGTLDDEFGRDLDTVVSSHGEPLTPPAWD